MEAIILAGGAGTRLKSVVPDLPKPMADIQGRPFLAYLLDHLVRQGVDRVLLSVGYHHEAITRHFGGGYQGLALDYVIEEEPLGTGGALRQALRTAHSQEVAVVNGDTYFGVDLRAMLASHLRHEAELTMGLKAVAESGRYGTVLFGAAGRIMGFREKGCQGPGYINAGVSIIDRALVDRLRPYGNAFSFEQEFLEPEIGRLRAYAMVSEAFFIDIGIPEDYHRAQAVLTQEVEREVASC